MLCWPYSAILLFTTKLPIQDAVLIFFFIEVKTDALRWIVSKEIKTTYTQKCKQGIIVGLDEVELTGWVEITHELLPNFKLMQVELQNNPLCTMTLKSDGACVVQLHGKYNCSCSLQAPPKYHVVFHSILENRMTLQRKNERPVLRDLKITVMGKDSQRDSFLSTPYDKPVILEPSFSLAINKVKTNLLNCSVSYEVGSVRVFMFCTENLYRPSITMSPEADEMNGTCATKKVTVEFGETRLLMLYEDQCKRNNSYTCIISGFSQGTVTQPLPTSQGETRLSRETSTAGAMKPSDVTNTEPPVLIKTSQSIMFTVAIFLVLCLTTFAVVAFLVYSNLLRKGDDDSDYYYSSSDSS